MTGRVVAFFISTNKTPSYQKAKEHISSLSKTFKFDFLEKVTGNLSLLLCYEGEIQIGNGEDISFCVGPLSSQKNSGYNVGQSSNAEIRDRFLSVTIEKNTVRIQNDYAGTIPVYYSLRGHISISNIEPAVILDSDTSFDDIDDASVFGFLHYSHLIWDETLYKHIKTQEPDCLFNYSIGSLSVEKKYLATLRSSDKHALLKDKNVGYALGELNQYLVESSFSGEDAEIVLPLSAGYDSRMIIAAIGKSNLKERLSTYTYGQKGSVDVEAARLLAKKHGVKWTHVELPCNFFSEEYIKKNSLIFGSSLHFHGMYQLEFFDTIRNSLKEASVLTSGFMTGVPAGQHIGTLKINSENEKLSEAMLAFSQSNYFSDEFLRSQSKFFTEDVKEKIECAFRKAFDRFDGRVDQKSVVFDVWTRQRNFIAYHPRVLEWYIPFISPHMSPIYANFYLSLSPRHLKDRLAVELMFKHFYPKAASVVTNSNGVKTLTRPLDYWIYRGANVFKKLGINNLLPRRYRNADIGYSLDESSLEKSREKSFTPLFSLGKTSSEYLEKYIKMSFIQELKKETTEAIPSHLPQLANLQAVAYGLSLLEK